VSPLHPVVLSGPADVRAPSATCSRRRVLAQDLGRGCPCPVQSAAAFALGPGTGRHRGHLRLDDTATLSGLGAGLALVLGLPALPLAVWCTASSRPPPTARAHPPLLPGLSSSFVPTGGDITAHPGAGHPNVDRLHLPPCPAHVDLQPRRLADAMPPTPLDTPPDSASAANRARRSVRGGRPGRQAPGVPAQELELSTASVAIAEAISYLPTRFIRTRHRAHPLGSMAPLSAERWRPLMLSLWRAGTPSSGSGRRPPAHRDRCRRTPRAGGAGPRPQPARLAARGLQPGHCRAQAGRAGTRCSQLPCGVTLHRYLPSWTGAGSPDLARPVQPVLLPSRSGKRPAALGRPASVAIYRELSAVHPHAYAAEMAAAYTTCVCRIATGSPPPSVKPVVV